MNVRAFSTSRESADKFFKVLAQFARMLESLLFDNFNKWTLACNGATIKQNRIELNKMKKRVPKINWSRSKTCQLDIEERR